MTAPLGQASWWDASTPRARRHERSVQEEHKGGVGGGRPAESMAAILWHGHSLSGLAVARQSEIGLDIECPAS